MPQIKKILFPVDFSDSCVGAGRYVQAFAEWFQPEIMLIHAAGAAGDGEAKTRLDIFLAAELRRFATQRVSIADDPAPAIAATAREWKPDLIMMATRGRGDFRRHLIGSITAKVLHDVESAVWTSVHAETALTLEEIGCSRILCALDFTDRGQYVLGWASWLARERQATLGIVHAIASVDPTHLAEPGDPALGGRNLAAAYQEYAFERAGMQLRGLQETVGMAAEIFIKPGPPAAVVGKTAAEFKADLLVIGRRSGGAVAGDIFHEASALVRVSPCPVITV